MTIETRAEFISSAPLTTVHVLDCLCSLDYTQHGSRHAPHPKCQRQVQELAAPFP